MWRGSVAFQHFCSLISFGKDFNSPSRRVRREAYMEIFAGLAGYTASRIYAEAIDLTKVEASVADLVIGLKALSQRWLLYTNDELYSLAFLLDINERGRVSWTDFYDFCVGVHEALTEDVRVLPGLAFENLYGDLMKLSELYAFCGVDVTCVKGAAVRSHGESPSSAAHGSEMSAAESMLIVTLADIAATARDAGFLPLTDLLSAVGPLASEIGVGALRSLLLSFGCSVDGEAAASPHSPVESRASKLSLCNPEAPLGKQPLAENSLQNLRTNLKSLKDSAFDISQKLLGQQEGVESTKGMWKSIESIEKNITSLSRSDSTLVNTSSSSSPKKRSSISKMFGAVGEGEDKHADSGPAVAEMVQMLQTIAATPSPAKTPNNGAARSRPSTTPPTPLHIAQSSVTARRKQIIKSSVKLDSSNSHMAQANSSASSSARKSPAGARGQINTTPLRSRPVPGTPGSRSSTPARPSPSSRSSTPGKAQSSSGERPVNLSIFKSPMDRQLSHPNRNVYDENTFQWQPSVRCNKYSERFQTTSDLQEGRKIISVFYNEPHK